MPRMATTTIMAISNGFTYRYLHEAVVEVRCSAWTAHQRVRKRRYLPEHCVAPQSSYVNILAESCSCQAASVLLWWRLTGALRGHAPHDILAAAKAWTSLSCVALAFPRTSQGAVERISHACLNQF